MGCICSKGVNPDHDEIPKRRKSLKHFVSLSKEEVVSHGGTQSLLPKQASANKATTAARQRWATVEVGNITNDIKATSTLGIIDVPNGVFGEHVAAGWPSWLTNVAGEAINGWLPRKDDSFEKLSKIGQGTYSSVYKARDLETGKIVALKKVRFENMDAESVRFMAREIQILRRLDHPNVIKLEGIIIPHTSSNLLLVFEYMEHDLAGLVARSDVKFTEPQVKCFIRQLLEGLAHCHIRGVLHRDIKGSNLLVDDNGILRIGDLGLATILNPDKKQKLTSHVVTLWYRPPELLLGATAYGVAVDLWSSGCILAELLAGRPIMAGRTAVEQLHKIFKLCGSPSDEYWKKSKLPNTTSFKPQQWYNRCVAETFKDFPPSALALLDVLLAVEPEHRGTADLALQSEFFTTKPFACDPSSLPKYPPSKEYDAKLRNEEMRKRVEAATRRSESLRPERRESKATGPPDPYMDQQKRQALRNSRSTSQRFNHQISSGAGYAHSGMNLCSFGSSWSKKLNHENHRPVPSCTYSSVRVENGPQLKSQRSYAGSSDFTKSSGIVAARTTNSWCNHLDAAQTSDKHVLDRTKSSHKKDETSDNDSTLVYANKNRRIHYSGTLMLTGGNVEDMFMEHERQIQQAVRKARLDKVKSKKGPFEEVMIS